MNEVEERVKKYYDDYGWAKEGELSGEDLLFRQFSKPYYRYHEVVNDRTEHCFEGLTEKLLIAGGGDLPESHVRIAGLFSDVTLLDISKRALDISRSKLGDRGEFILGSILDIPKPEDYFDAIYCAHVIYHIDKDLQKNAIRELLRVTKPGGRIVLIYGNPDALPVRIMRVKARTPLLWKLRRKSVGKVASPDARPSFYGFLHPLDWWSQFEDACRVDIRPWDVMGVEEEAGLFFNDFVASLGYSTCAWIERRFPHYAARNWTYPLIVMEKIRPNPAGN